MDAVVLDLFGTLVPAPTPDDRARAADRLAAIVGCDADTVVRYFRTTWRVRHDGTLPTLPDLASHLVHALHGPARLVGAVSNELLHLGRSRLEPARSTVRTLRSLRCEGMRLGVLSDASAEIAAAWSKSQLMTLVDTIVFSCEAGAVKPDLRLYGRIGDELDVPAHRTLYVGDGGGHELSGAVAAGMNAVAVRRRGPDDALVFCEGDWLGPCLPAVEEVPAYLAELR